MKRFSIYTLLLLASGLLFTACDDGGYDPKPQDTTTEVSIMMHYTYDGQPFDARQQYQLTDAGGNDATIDFSFVGFIVSDLVIVYDDGTEATLNDSYQVFDAHLNPMQTLSFGKFELGDKSVAGIRFHIGLNPALNGIDPVAELSEEHVLYRPDMHWGWNPEAGYKFIRYEADYTLANAPDSAREITYHIANDENFQEVSTLASVAPKANENGDLTWHVDFDVKSVLDDIDLTTEDFSMSSADVVAVTNKVKANFANAAFSANDMD
ncbi:MAG: MbnP family protein [Bacteroidota bacterium]